MKIKSLHAREVLNSRGQPAVEAELNGVRAISPEGASKGKYEAVDIRDGGQRYRGLGVKRAVENINKLSFQLRIIERIRHYHGLWSGTDL